jgi:hypothetical protein
VKLGIRMVDRLTSHLLALAGAIVTIASLVALLASESVKTWAKSHGYWIFIAWILTILVAFIVVDYATNRKRKEATQHDRDFVGRLLSRLPPDGPTISWLKYGFISTEIAVKQMEPLDKLNEQLALVVVGLDNREANDAYDQLRDAIGEFERLVTLHLQLTPDYKRFKMPRMTDEKFSEARQELLNARGMLLTTYDNFLKICHKNRLDSGPDQKIYSAPAQEI